MLTNNLRLALRHLLKNRTYSAINIVGLSVAVAAALLIFRVVLYELSFDRNFKNFDRIGRVVTFDKIPEGEFFTPGLPLPAMDAAQQSVAQFTAFSRVSSFGPTIVIQEPGGFSKKIPTDGEREAAAFVEPAFFSIFDWPWLAGEPQSALAEPNSIVLSKNMAERCFGSWQAAVGRTVMVEGLVPAVVRGVFEDAPLSSDFQFNAVMPWSAYRKNAEVFGYQSDWGSTNSSDQAFALLADAADRPAAEASLAQVGQKEYNQNGNPNSRRTHLWQPLSELHSDAQFYGGFGMHTTERSRLWVLGLVGLLVLAMACFNFINLATAQAAGRSREVGVRKSLGGSRGQLVRQFMGETGLFVAGSVGVGAVLARLALPFLKKVSDVPDAQPFLTDPMVPLFLLGLAVAVSVLSGFYPAVVLSGFEPVQALKTGFSQRTVGGVGLRKVLVVGQFAIAQALLVATLVSVQQMDFIRKMDLGFQPRLVYDVQNLQYDSLGVAKFDVFKQKLAAIPAVESVSLSSDVPASGNTSSSNFSFDSSTDANFNVTKKAVDADYFRTHGLHLAAGRALEPCDTVREYVVNRFLLKKLGVKDPAAAIGKLFRIGGGGPQYPVVGVVEDFTAHSARQAVEPLVMYSRKARYRHASLKIRPENMAATVAQVRRVFEETFPEQVFEGEFMDKRIADFYDDEARLSLLCKSFAGLAVVIACLGLFGLASLMAASRVKEIGVRKVLGASAGQIVGLLSVDFLKLVAVAAAIALPVGHHFMKKWLDGFAFRMQMPWGLLVGVAVLAAAVAFLTVGIRAWGAARVDPVRSLRSE